jgi:anti-sigma factor (TIGR02949 family)
MSPTPPDGPTDPSRHDPTAAQMSEQDCDDAISQLYLYLDGELDADVIARIEEHLQRCSPCLEAYDFEAELRRVISAKCNEDVPGETRSRILGLLDRLDAGEFDDDASASV